jgi:hypothetical protein
MARGRIALDIDDYKQMLRTQEKYKGRLGLQSYDRILDILISDHQKPDAKYPALPNRITNLRNQKKSGPEIFKELRPTTWKEAAAGLSPFKGTIYKDTLSELKLMLQPFTDAAGLAADFLPGFEKPPNLLTEKGRKEAALRYPALGALSGLALEVAKLAHPLDKPTYTGEEFKQEFPMISGLATYYGDTYNVFTPDGREAFRRHLKENPAGFLGDFATFFAPPLKAGKAAIAGSKAGQALKASKLGQSTAGKITGTVIKNLDIDPVAMITDAGAPLIGKGAEKLAKFAENAVVFAGSKLSGTPVQAAKKILEKADPTVLKMLKGQMTYDEILAPFVIAADEAWEGAKRRWKQNEANLRGITDDLGNPKNFYYILDEVENRAKRQLEKLNVTLTSREKVLKEAVLGDIPTTGRPLQPTQELSAAGRPSIIEEAIVTEQLTPMFAGKLESDRGSQRKINELWKTIQAHKNEALLNAAKRPDGLPFIDFDDLQGMKQQIDYIGGRKDESDIYKYLYGPMKETISNKMVQDIGNYKILNEDWKKTLGVLEGTDDALNLPTREPRARKAMLTPTKKGEMPAMIKKRRAAIQGILSVFKTSDPWGKQATDILSELVPNDLTQMAAGFHFIDPEIRIAGGPVYLTATGRAAAANPLIAPAMALTSPTVFGKMLLWWVDKKEAVQIMHELKANKLGPYRLAIESPKLLTTPAGRTASKLGVRARRGGAIDTIRQSLYQPSSMEEQYIESVN